MEPRRKLLRRAFWRFLIHKGDMLHQWGEICNEAIAESWANFTPSAHRCGHGDPKTENFMQLWNIQVAQLPQRDRASP